MKDKKKNYTTRLTSESIRQIKQYGLDHELMDNEVIALAVAQLVALGKRK